MSQILCVLLAIGCAALPVPKYVDEIAPGMIYFRSPGVGISYSEGRPTARVRVGENARDIFGWNDFIKQCSSQESDKITCTVLCYYNQAALDSEFEREKMSCAENFPTASEMIGKVLPTT